MHVGPALAARLSLADREREEKLAASRRRQETLRHFIAAHRATQGGHARERQRLERTNVVQQLREVERKYHFEKEMEQIAQRQLSRELLYMSDPERSGHAGGPGPLPLHPHRDLRADFGEAPVRGLHRSLQIGEVHEAAANRPWSHSSRSPTIHHHGIIGAANPEHDGGIRPPTDHRQGVGKSDGSSGAGPSGHKRRPGERHLGGDGNDLWADTEEPLKRPRISESHTIQPDRSKGVRGQLALVTAAGRTKLTFRPYKETMMGPVMTVVPARSLDMIRRSATIFNEQAINNCTQHLAGLSLSAQQATAPTGQNTVLLPPLTRLTTLSGQLKEIQTLAQGSQQIPMPPESPPSPDGTSTNETELTSCTTGQVGLGLGSGQIDRPTPLSTMTAPTMLTEKSDTCKDV